MLTSRHENDLKSYNLNLNPDLYKVSSLVAAFLRASCQKKNIGIQLVIIVHFIEALQSSNFLRFLNVYVLSLNLQCEKCWDKIYIM